MRKLYPAVALFFLLSVCTLAFASPADTTKPYTLKQPDGSTFQAFKRGDESANWIVSKNGEHIVVYDKTTGYWDFAVIKNGNLAPSSSHYRDGATPPSGAATKYVSSQAPRRMSYNSPKGLKSIFAPQGAEVKRWTPRTTPLSGDAQALFIRVTFENTRNPSNNILSIDLVEQSKDIWGSDRSVKQYYLDQSKNRLKLAHNQLLTDGIINIDLTSADYPANSGDHPDTLLDGNGSHKHEVNFVQSVLKRVQKDYPGLNFKKFDANSDDIITHDELVVYLVLAGYEGATTTGKSPSVWAHAWDSFYGEGTTSKDRVYISGDLTLARWSMNGELTTNAEDEAIKLPMIGVMCHELGHQLCSLPDLYDVSYYNEGLGLFSLMAGGNHGAHKGKVHGSCPVNLDAWSRYHLGWETPTEPAVSGTLQKLNIPTQNFTDNTGVLKINAPSSVNLPYQYYLMEVRNPADGKWDSGMQSGFDLANPKKGVLVIHVDETIGGPTYDDGNDINQMLTQKGGSEILHPHQGVMAIWPYGDPRVKNTDRGCQESLWYDGNTSADAAAGITPDAEKDFLKSSFFSDASANKRDTETGIRLFDFSAPADTMTCSFKVNGQSGGGSGGGCSATAWPALLVFAAIPFVVKRRRK